MQFRTTSSPHLEDTASVSNVMQQVLLALLPATFMGIWLFGWGVLTNLALAIAFALAFESAALMMRRRSVTRFLSDYSAVLTAWLLALAIPPMSEWWLIAIGMFFAIVVAKHLYGGIGYNPFNPAMVGYVVLLISFPLQMTQWLIPDLGGYSTMSFVETLVKVLTGSLPEALQWDAVTQATALDVTKNELDAGKVISEIQQSESYGWLGCAGWELMGLAYAVGGVWLIFKGLIDWRTPLAMLAGLAVPALIFFIISAEHYPSPVFHLLSGAALMGAFFIVTDPVSGCSSTRGRIIFAVGVGVITWIIRTWGGFPDGVAFAVLLMNMSAPMIDYYTQPRVFGKGS